MKTLVTYENGTAESLFLLGSFSPNSIKSP